MPKIDISDADFLRLQKFAEPLVDTSASAFTKVLDLAEASKARAKRVSATMKPSAEVFSAERIPPLTHTKLMFAEFDGKEPEKTSWDSLVRLALVTTLVKCKSFRELQRISGANLVERSKTDEGYKYVSEHKFSYQGVSAEDAVKIVVRCAKALRCQLNFEFEWRDKDDAYRPGKRGMVTI